MTKREHRRLMTEALRSYREALDEANLRATKAETHRDQLLDSLVRARSHRDYGHGGARLMIALECDEFLTSGRLGPDDYRRLAERIVTGLAGLSRDYRGDLRQTESQRLLGIRA